MSLQSEALKLVVGPGVSVGQTEASKFVARRGLPGGSTSTLRKVMRARRIARGDRPFPAEQSLSTDGKRRLHPTKGWRPR